MIKVAINGFGRIGRGTFRFLLENENIKVVAINDLADAATLSHLLKYDSVFGVSNREIESSQNSLIVDGEKVQVLKEKEPKQLPWKTLEVDVVLECTGAFRHYEDAKKHLKAGAKKVIISATCKDPEKVPSIVLGVNDKNLDVENIDIFDMGSCTTNCLAPIVKILNDKYGIKNGFMTTIHSYTTSQNLLDGPHKDLRRARAAALNLVPTTTGAAKAIGYVVPELQGKLDGMALRVPTPLVSVVDLVCRIKDQTTRKEINDVFKKEAQKENWRGIFTTEDKPLVSSDYISNTNSSIVDLPSTKVIDDLVKVIAWYDNESGYAHRLADFSEFIGKKI
jgi:glyceraldehyde 3-phosphate dehydrogenase